MRKELLVQSHRTFPMPVDPWIMTQEWHHTLFAHWPLPAGMLRDNVPPELEIDTYDGDAWIGIVPFQVKNTRGRFIPPIPFFSHYIEVNARTYVTYKGNPGVYFFSLDANQLTVVFGAKLFFGLPYKQANIRFRLDDTVKLDSIRLPVSDASAKLHVSYRPENDVFFAEPGTLEHWFTERYCLWTKRGNGLYRADIHHTKWELQRASAEIMHDNLVPMVGQNPLQSQPLLHYNAFKKAFFWPLKQEND